RNVEVKRDRCRGSRIADVMDPGRMGQAEQPEVFAFIGEAKFAGESMELNVADKQVGLAGGAVGKDGALDVCDDCLDVRLVDTQDSSAVKRYTVDELSEGVLDVGERRVLVEVLAIDCRNDRHHRGEEKEAAVAFVGFDDEVLTLAEAGRAAGLVDLATDDKR